MQMHENKNSGEKQNLARMKKVTHSWFHTTGKCGVYRFHIIVSTVKSRQILWAGHLARN
jgi:hypothetical protein